MATTAQRVNGVAAVGDAVVYFDIANQNRNPEQVTSTPDQNRDPKYGWSQGYGLRDTVTGTERFSDLRQHGWTFAG